MNTQSKLKRAYIGIRTDRDTQKSLAALATAARRTLSDYCRIVLEDHATGRGDTTSEEAGNDKARHGN